MSRREGPNVRALSDYPSSPTPFPCTALRPASAAGGCISQREKGERKRRITEGRAFCYSARASTRRGVATGCAAAPPHRQGGVMWSGCPLRSRFGGLRKPDLRVGAGRVVKPRPPPGRRREQEGATRRKRGARIEVLWSGCPLHYASGVFESPTYKGKRLKPLLRGRAKRGVLFRRG